MYGIEMKYTVKTLLERGYSQRAIASELSINRKTIANLHKKNYFYTPHNKNVKTFLPLYSLLTYSKYNV